MIQVLLSIVIINCALYKLSGSLEPQDLSECLWHTVNNFWVEMRRRGRRRSWRRKRRGAKTQNLKRRSFI